MTVNIDSFAPFGPLRRSAPPVTIITKEFPPDGIIRFTFDAYINAIWIVSEDRDNRQAIVPCKLLGM